MQKDLTAAEASQEANIKNLEPFVPRVLKMGHRAKTEQKFQQ